MAVGTLKKGSVSSTSKQTVYTAGISTTASVANAVLTNASNSEVSVSVFVSDGADNDTLVTVAELKAGVGKSKIIVELIGGINSQSKIKLQSNTATGFNYIIYGEVKST